MAEDRSITPKAEGSPAPVDDARIGNPAPLVRGTVDELERILDSRHVVGEPLTFGDTTVIPLISIGFGFGAGGGGGRQASNGDEGGGGGGGGGGGMKPIAVLVIQGDRVEVAPVPGIPSGAERLGVGIAAALEKYAGRKDDEED